jgi:RecA/RadA recombinase
MATKKPKAATQSRSPVDMLAIVSDLEKVVKIQSITLGAEDRVSTGLLCLDVILGGGITAGWYTFSGAEQSAKTTTAITAMASAVKQNVSMPVLWDAEQSSGSSIDYVSNIMQSCGVNKSIEELFGVRKNGKYVTVPLVYYRDEGELETFFDWTSALLRRLPDKRLENGQWWYIYEDTKENRAKYKEVLDAGMTRASNGIYIPAEDGSLQAYILIDSYPSLVPKAMDDDDPSAGMALAAREFAKHIPRVKGKLRSKRVAIVGINQIREKPGFNMGDPRYEPGGQALRFNSDVRVWNTPRALSGVPYNPKGKGSYEEEDSVEFDGGKDTYRYINSKAIKNKLSIPNRDTWLRIWVKDGDEKARGFCPVFDVFHYLMQTGQASGKRSSITLNVSGIGPAKKAINWMEFKTLVLCDKEGRQDVFDKIGYPNVNLRNGLFKQFKSGLAEDLYIANLRGPVKVSKDSEAEDDSDDGDDE